MGQRLVIQITEENGEPLANAYYHWSAYTGSAAELTTEVLGWLEDADDKLTNKQKAAWVLFKTGARFNPQEIMSLKNKSLFDEFKFLIDEKECDRNDGLLSVTDEGMKENTDWEEGRVDINIVTKEIYFGVISTETVEEYLEYNSDYEGCLPPDKLPVIDFSEELEFTLDEWFKFYGKLVSMLACNHFVGISSDKTTVYQFIA